MNDTQIMESYNFTANVKKILENLDGSAGKWYQNELLIAIIIPSTLIGGMLFISIILACILHCSNKKNERKAELRDKNPIYKQK